MIPGTPNGGTLGGEPHAGPDRGPAITLSGSSEMGFTIGTRQIARAMSDGTGLTEEEIGVLVLVAALVAALVAFLRTVITLVDALPFPWSRAEERRRARR